MKTLTPLAVPLFAVSLLAGSLVAANFDAAAQDGKKPQDVYTLAKEAKLGTVKFNHLDHTTKNRGVDGKQAACTDCHHTAQPVAEVLKHPPHKTAWPADRTTTLTADLFEKDPSAPPVDICTDCHSRTETKPKLLPEIPQIKLEGSAEPVTLNNQQAFHRRCGSCHDEIAKTKETTTAPTSKKCVACHKKTAAA
ncbi:MAG TPA: cytochrome c3 family protein [Pyrinomonadaceae bacterium]|nr:cytochrome c3 family protein [Pyrinomonadaceae bacterium]